MSRDRGASLCFASLCLAAVGLALLCFARLGVYGLVVSYLVVRLDVQLDLFAGQSADSAGGKDWSA
jgi:hypothetical protein